MQESASNVKKWKKGKYSKKYKKYKKSAKLYTPISRRVHQFVRDKDLGYLTLVDNGGGVGQGFNCFSSVNITPQDLILQWSTDVVPVWRKLKIRKCVFTITPLADASLTANLTTVLNNCKLWISTNPYDATVPLSQEAVMKDSAFLKQYKAFGESIVVSCRPAYLNPLLAPLGATYEIKYCDSTWIESSNLPNIYNLPRLWLEGTGLPAGTVVYRVSVKTYYDCCEMR